MTTWQSFYVMLGSSAAALIGLQFVVVALVANMRRLANASTIHAFGTPTVAHLGSVLIISAIMSAPWPSPVPVAIALVICGVGGFGYAVIVIRRVRQQPGYEPDWQDWLWYAVVPCGLYAALAVAGLLLLAPSPLALFLVAGAAIGLLLLGIRNSCDSITYVVSGADAEGAESEQPLKPPHS